MIRVANPLTLLKRLAWAFSRKCPQCGGIPHSWWCGACEALEALRRPGDDGDCDKCHKPWAGSINGRDPCPKCSGSGQALGGSRFAEELADVVIRVLDIAEGHSIDLLPVIEAKHAYNQTRPTKHGKAF